MDAIRILTRTQETFLRAFFDPLTDLDRIYLSGGTALGAFYLHHRYSDDLDFFTRAEGDVAASDSRVERAAAAAGLTIRGVDGTAIMRRFRLDGDVERDHRLEKVEVIWDTPPHFAQPRLIDGVPVDDARSIAINKITALSRLEPKDYIDLFLLVRDAGYPLHDLIPSAKEKDPGVTEWALIDVFLRVRELRNIAGFLRGYMVKAVEWDEVQDFYVTAAERLIALFPPPAR
jgi:Nucleotidyl transferase AbiEii toxin, Type IV TA system